MVRTRSTMLATAFALLGTCFAAHAEDPCTQWDLSGYWELSHTNGALVKMDIVQSGDAITGRAEYCRECDEERGIGERFREGPFNSAITGSIDGTSLRFTIPWWEGYMVGEYSGSIDEGGRISGRTQDSIRPENVANWNGNRPAVCVSRRLPAAEQTPQDVPPPIDAQLPPQPPAKPVRCLGKASWTATAKDDVDIYDGPGGEFAVVGILAAAASAPITGQKDDWFQLKTASAPGGSGWVAGDHLTTVLKRPACPH